MKETLAVLPLAVALWVMPCVAQQGGGNQDPGQPPPPPPHPILTALDTDGDGELSAAEIAAAPQSLLKLDKNGDGKLSREELRPPRPHDGQGPQHGQGNADGKQHGKSQRKDAGQGQGQSDGNSPPPPPGGAHGQPPPPPPLLHALDTNKDGELSADEIANAAKSLLTLDKNGDGKLDRMELRPPPPGQRPGEGSGRDRKPPTQQ
jgi:hypothetical protein